MSSKIEQRMDNTGEVKGFALELELGMGSSKRARNSQ